MDVIVQRETRGSAHRRITSETIDNLVRSVRDVSLQAKGEGISNHEIFEKLSMARVDLDGPVPNTDKHTPSSPGRAKGKRTVSHTCVSPQGNRNADNVFALRSMLAFRSLEPNIGTEDVVHYCVGRVRTCHQSLYGVVEISNRLLTDSWCEHPQSLACWRPSSPLATMPPTRQSR